ncbi:uncharacterized protein ACOB8E_004925 [Sarcophilus harrisii]
MVSSTPGVGQGRSGAVPGAGPVPGAERGGAHALEKVPAAAAAAEAEAEAGPPGSSCQRFMQRRRAFMKKLLTVLSSRPSCCEMVTCISLDGRLFSLKMAISVRRCR